MSTGQPSGPTFPILDQQVHGQPLIYFDNAATTQKPRAVIEALRHYYEHDNANVHRGIHELSNRATAAFEAARTRAAQFINARSADEIIFTRGTTEGINLVAQAWGSKHLKAGRHDPAHGDGAPQQHRPVAVAGRAHGRASSSYLPVTGDIGLLDLSRLDECLTRKVKLFAMTHISNSLGTINPGGGPVRAGAPARRDDARGCRAKRRAPAHGRAGDRLRFPRLLRPQDVRADGHWGAVWAPGSARSHAAVSGRRRNDPERGVPAEHLEARAAPVRGRHAGHLRRRGLARGDGLPRRRSGGTTSRSTTRNSALTPTPNSPGSSRASGSSARTSGGPGW